MLLSKPCGIQRVKYYPKRQRKAWRKKLVKNKKRQNDSKRRKDLLDDEKERLDGCRKNVKKYGKIKISWVILKTYLKWSALIFSYKYKKLVFQWNVRTFSRK